MFGGNIIKRLTGAVKNGVVWGSAWFLLAMGVFGILRITNDNPVSWLDAIGMSLRIGIAGGVIGGAFAAAISLFYRGKRLSEISAVRFGLGGAVAGGLLMFAWLALGNVLTGGDIPWNDIGLDLIYATLFGGIAAGGSMWLAQREPTSADDIDAEPDRLGPGDPSPIFSDQRARTPEPVPRRERI